MPKGVKGFVRKDAPEGTSVGDNELESLRQQLEAKNNEVNIMREEMVKSQSVGAIRKTKLRTWPGVDYDLPAFAVNLVGKSQDGIEQPARGNVTVQIPGGTGVLTFVDGWCVTNDLNLARGVRHSGSNYSIEQVNS